MKGAGKYRHFSTITDVTEVSTGLLGGMQKGTCTERVIEHMILLMCGTEN